MATRPAEGLHPARARRYVAAGRRAVSTILIVAGVVVPWCWGTPNPNGAGLLGGALMGVGAWLVLTPTPQTGTEGGTPHDPQDHPARIGG